MWDAEVDVAVIGAGGCGLVAALTAAEAGLEVAVFEKTEFVLGNTAASAGMIPAANTRFQKEHGIYETADVMAEDILRKNKYESDEALTYALAEASGELIEWMADSLEINLSLVTEFSYPGHSNLRMHAPKSRSGLELMRLLKNRLTNHDSIYLMLKSPALDLITESDEVTGVKVKTDYGEQKIKAKKVILATNGFGGNKELVEKFIPEIKDALYFGYEANTGEGIEMGVKVGASLSNMHGYQAHSAVNEGTGLLVTWGTVMLGGFIVNKQGKRFANETSGYSEFAKEVLKEANETGFIIINQAIYDELLSIEDFRQLDEMKAFRQAETIEDLARSLEIPADNLLDTFTNYVNQKDGRADQFGRQAFPEKFTGPFYGIKIVPALFHTQGGLKINSNAQVIDIFNRPVKHLYAGGGTAVGVSGDHDYGYMSGNGLLAAFGFGRIAAKHAAKAIKDELND